MKINNFRGDLTDISANKEALLQKPQTAISIGLQPARDYEFSPSACSTHEERVSTRWQLQTTLKSTDRRYHREPSLLLLLHSVR